MKEAKIGIIGIAWGTAHMETIGELEGARVGAIAFDRTHLGKTVHEYAAEVGAVGYTDGVKMIAEADIDAIDIVVAPKWREPLVEAAVKRGLPTLIEKPMALSVAQAERWAQIAAGIPVMIEYPLRFHLAMQRMKELLYDGPLGKPVSVEGNLQTMWNAPEGHWTWDKENPGGLLNECGCHMIDTVCFLCGKPTSVFSVGGNVMGYGANPDTAAMTIQFENGSHAFVNAGGLGTIAFSAPMFVRVFAEKGEARVTGADWMFGRVEWALHGDDAEIHDESYEIPPRRQILRYNMKNFIRVVREGIAPPCSAQDGITVQKIIEGMVDSINSGDVVGIE